MTRLPRALVASLAVAGLLCLAACSGDGGKKKKESTPPPPPSSSTSAAPSTPASKPAAGNPLRGGAATTHGVVAVKIDDTANGRPQHNIDQADIVYIEEVEGGLTRLLAVFSTNLPKVESVRSTRAADPEILAQYGKIAYVASGGAKNPLQVLNKSPLKTDINDKGGPGFERTGDRGAPYNLQADLSVIAKALKAPRARSVGFSWSSSGSQLAGASAGTKVETVVGGTPVEFRYNAQTHRYARYINGQLQKTAEGKVISTPNVIVQFCKVKPYYADRDVNGNPNAYTYTVGTGKVVVFRDGKQVPGTWTRKSADTGTAYHNSKGQSILLRPGGAWVVLTKTGNKLN